MTIRPKIQSIPSQITDLYKRVRRLEANPCDCDGGSGDAGGIEHRDEPYIILPLIEGGWNQFGNDFWHLVMDTDDLYGGHIHNDGDLGSQIQWDVFLPAMREFKFFATGRSGPDGGCLHAYFQQMTLPAVPSQGVTYPQFISAAVEPSGSVIEAMNPGSSPQCIMDFYKATPGINDSWVTFPFRLFGDEGDPITHMTGADGNGFWGDGGPGWYRITLQTDSQDGASSGYYVRLQSIAIHFAAADWL